MFTFSKDDSRKCITIMIDINVTDSNFAHVKSELQANVRRSAQFLVDNKQNLYDWKMEIAAAIGKTCSQFHYDKLKIAFSEIWKQYRIKYSWEDQKRKLKK